ncbi:MAG: hypothetical protein WB992_22460 [Bryobacteraceae bacterium]
MQVQAGTPLRVYISRRVSYRLGEAVQAKLIEPVWAFDRVVIPAGVTLQGQVLKLDPVSRIVRARAILGGDFTPLKRARVSFMSLTLPNGRAVPLRTEESLGLPTMYVPPRPAKKPKKQKTASGKPSRAGQFLRQQVQNQARSQANARSGGLYDFVRGPNKREWLENYLWSKLPYHPQWYRTRTRFDTVLTQPLDFGTVEVASSEIAKSGAAAPPDTIAQMRLLATVSSADARVSDPVEGELSQPVFDQQHELVLPEGTRFTGKVTLTHRARLFHRGGKLRFTIERVDVPGDQIASERTATVQRAGHPVQGQLVAVEADPNAIKVDSEGTATATESKSRLLRPAIAALVAAKSLDNDAGKQTASGTGSPNTGGRALGGFSGFGLLGTAAARGPRPIGEALGFYGLAWSVYSNIISRGNEVTFEKNTAIAIQFGSPRKK